MFNISETVHDLAIVRNSYAVYRMVQFAATETMEDRQIVTTDN